MLARDKISEDEEKKVLYHLAQIYLFQLKKGENVYTKRSQVIKLFLLRC